MDPVTIIMLLLPVLQAGLQTAGVLPSNYSSLITSSLGALAPLVKQLLGQTTITDKELAVLQAVKAEIDALKASNVATFTLNDANEINALDAAIFDAITAYQSSKVKTDPSNLTPLPTTL